LYARLGWDLPPYSIRDSQGIEFAARQVRISLIVSGMQVSQSFGAIEQDPGFASPQTLVAEAIAHPDDYYVNLGNEYCRQRNIDLAAEAYQRALEYKPDNADAQQGLDTCR
jgi:tetratricopeptide (TPR) repeat protein